MLKHASIRNGYAVRVIEKFNPVTEFVRIRVVQRSANRHEAAVGVHGTSVADEIHVAMDTAAAPRVAGVFDARCDVTGQERMRT